MLRTMASLFPVRWGFIKNIWANIKGTTTLEFSLVWPVLFLLSFGAFEVTNYVLVRNRLSLIAEEVATWLSGGVSIIDINDAFVGAWLLGKDINFAEYGGIKVSGVAPLVGIPTCLWQMAWSGTQFGDDINTQTTITPALKIKQAATLTDITISSDKDKIVIVELFYKHEPLMNHFAHFVSTNIALKSYAYYRSQVQPFDTLGNT